MRARRTQRLAASLLLAAVPLLARGALAAPGCDDVHLVTLLKEARYGLAPDEKAAWLVRDREGRDTLIFWPATAHYRAHRWLGPIPTGAVALLHTHPVGANPRPSVTDQETARRIGLPVYTVTRAAVFRADPDDTIHAVRSPLWSPWIDWTRAKKLLDTPRPSPSAPEAALSAEEGLPVGLAALRAGFVSGRRAPRAEKTR